MIMSPLFPAATVYGRQLQVDKKGSTQTAIPPDASDEAKHTHQRECVGMACWACCSRCCPMSHTNLMIGPNTASLGQLHVLQPMPSQACLSVMQGVVLSAFLVCGWVAREQLSAVVSMGSRLASFLFSLCLCAMSSSSGYA